jgi:hypothetical protein
MKTGIIVYVTGDDSKMNEAEQKKIIKDQMKADRVESISAQHGQYDINDAWRTLAARGVHRVLCVLAECTGMGNIKILNQQLQLCG